MRVNIKKSEMIMTAYFDQIYQTLAWFSRIRIWIGFDNRAPGISLNFSVLTEAGKIFKKSIVGEFCMDNLGCQ
jgi:hypothetical protein